VDKIGGKSGRWSDGEGEEEDECDVRPVLMTFLYFSQSKVEGEEEGEARGTGRGGREEGEGKGEGGGWGNKSCPFL